MQTRRYRFLPAALLGTLPVFLAGCGGSNLSHYLQNPWGLGCCGFIILLLDVIALVEVVGSNRSTGDKLLWGLLIFFFPIFGLIVYYMFGRQE